MILVFFNRGVDLYLAKVRIVLVVVTDHQGFEDLAGEVIVLVFFGIQVYQFKRKDQFFFDCQHHTLVHQLPTLFPFLHQGEGSFPGGLIPRLLHSRRLSHRFRRGCFEPIASDLSVNFINFTAFDGIDLQRVYFVILGNDLFLLL